jgi:hypothetical protein
MSKTPYALTPPLDISRLRRRHPQANQSTWIAMLQSSNLYRLGPKYPSGQPFACRCAGCDYAGGSRLARHRENLLASLGCRNTSPLTTAACIKRI